MTPTPIPEDFKKAMHDEVDRYAFRVPYDGSNKFYDEKSIKDFIAGAEWAYRHLLASQQTMRWVKASEQLPEREKPIFFEIEWSEGECQKLAGKFMFVLNEDCFVANAISYPIRKYINAIRWLDESPAPTT